MPHLQVKNVPAPLHRKIQKLARERGTTVRELVLDAVRREVGREELRARLKARAPVELGRPAARTLEEVRAERERAGQP